MKQIKNFILNIVKAIPVLNTYLSSQHISTILHNSNSINKKIVGLSNTTPTVKKRSIRSRILLGVKKGWNTPTLPDNILKIQSYPIIRILRFLGGSSFLLILSKNYSNNYILYICMLFATIFTIYHFVITFYRIKHMIKILKSNELDIRNSPLDKLALLGARALFCLKNACDSAQPVGLTLGLLLGTDEILKGAKREPIFSPFLGGILNSILPEDLSRDSVRLINKDISELENNQDELAAIKDLESRFQKLELKGDISKNEFEEFQKGLHENKDLIINQNEKIKSKILIELDNLKKGKK